MTLVAVGSGSMSVHESISRRPVVPEGVARPPLPTAGGGLVDERAAARFWAQVNKTETCWLWTGSGTKNGYGQFRCGGQRVLAHRWAWEQKFGAFPAGLQSDHLCRNRACVNPDHIEPVTNRENQRRGFNPNAAKTHCPSGHPYSGDNLHVTYRIGRYGFSGVHRGCRGCEVRDQERHNMRRRAAGRQKG